MTTHSPLKERLFDILSAFKRGCTSLSPIIVLMTIIMVERGLFRHLELLRRLNDGHL